MATSHRTFHTLLEAIVDQQRLTWEEAARRVEEAAKRHEGESISISPRHLARLARRERGESRPHPATQRALQYAFGYPAEQLLAPYAVTTTDIVHPRDDTQEVLTLAADRAQHFALNLPGMSDLTVDQLAESVRDLALAYPNTPLPRILGQLVTAQDTIYRFLEQPQRPQHGRQLYFLAAVVGGMLAKASHDLDDSSAALTQARTAYLCAEQADHHGLKAWISGLQSLISYWAGRPHEAIRYAQRGSEFATRAQNTTAVWLPASEARAWARLGNAAKAEEAIRCAEEAWANVQPDDLDELGGIATFTRPRQLYYASDALRWLPEHAEGTERYAQDAVTAYADQTSPEWSFSDQAGSHANLALARVHRGELDGAVEALEPVLSLPVEQRIGGIIKSVQYVHTALTKGPLANDSAGFQEAIEAFARTPVRALSH